MVDWRTLWRRCLPDTPALSGRQAFLSAVTVALAVGFTAWFSGLWWPHGAAPLLIASMGASGIILLVLFSSPMAQPWAFVGGHAIGVTVGLAMAFAVPSPLWGCVLALGITVFAMLKLRCLHPPAGAATLIPVLLHAEHRALDWHFLLAPVLTNVAVLLALALVVNRMLGRAWPHQPLAQASRVQGTHDPAPTERVGITLDDVQRVVRENQTLSYTGASELHQLLRQVEGDALRRQLQSVTCLSVMARDVVTIAASEPVSEVWRLLRRHKVKALPVCNAQGQLVGIVTLVDLLKHIPVVGVQEDAHVLAQWLRGQYKGEPTVADVMTPQPYTVAPDQSLVDLVPLLSDAGLHHVPVVEHGTLVGMLTQSDLIAGLHRVLVQRAVG